MNCNAQKTITKELTNGSLVYNITGEGTTNWELEIFFNSENTIIREQYATGGGRKYIFDKKSNEILGLYDDVGFPGSMRNSYIIYHTPKGLIRNALSSNYGDTTIIKTKEFKNILGYKCQKTIIEHGNQVTVEVWTTPKIKTGLLYPWTPLIFEDLALEYEIKILGEVDRRYEIKSISSEKIEEKEFQHSVPDDYYLNVPYSVFSLKSLWSDRYKENKFTSFQYPTFKNGRNSVKDYIRDGLNTIFSNGKLKDIVLEFTITKKGELKNIVVDYRGEKDYKDSIEKMLKEMPNWEPAKVKGVAVNSKVKIII